MSASKNIVGILDIDGFQIEKNKFLYRELGIIGMNEEKGMSYHVKIHKRERENLMEKKEKEIRYVQRYIHGLTFMNRHGVNHYEMKHIIAKFYNENKTEKRYLMAYKGGVIEKNLLNDMKIPSINLEFMGCPKTVDIYPYMSNLESCGRHVLLANNKDEYKHCPKVEVEAFLYWLKRRINGVIRTRKCIHF